MDIGLPSHELGPRARLCMLLVGCATVLLLAATAPSHDRPLAARASRGTGDFIVLDESLELSNSTQLIAADGASDEVEPEDSAVVWAPQKSTVPPATMVGLHFDPSAVTTQAAVRPGEFIADAMGRQYFEWSMPRRSVKQAIEAAFPSGSKWTPVKFTEGRNTTWTLEGVALWVEQELLGGPDPFAVHGKRVPVPFNDEADTGDQLGPRQFVGYSRRQICYIVAKSLVGAGTKGYRNGLLRFLEKATGGGAAARNGDFGRSWWGLLAACAADPALEGGGQGPQLVVAKAGEPNALADLRAFAREVAPSTASLRVCRYDDGSNGEIPDGVQPVPPEGCQQPRNGQPGKDFMTGGLPGQATQDISAAWLGGYVFGNAVGLGGGQDERLMVFFPEVAALTFFLSQSPSQAPQLRQPVWILGARRLFTGIDGTCRFESPLRIDVNVPLTSDLATVMLNGRRYHMSSSRPFVAFMSDNQDYLSTLPPQAQSGALQLARKNKEPLQRDVSPSSPWSVEKQVRAWHRAVSLRSYSEAVQPALQTLVTSVGTGPWFAGLWFGDSQIGFLVSLIGQALAAESWGRTVPLDYYIYSSFTENPGNQCFVHPREQCHACIERCSKAPLPQESYWLPANGYLDGAGRNPCVMDKADCGLYGLEDVLKVYRNRTLSALWTDLETVLWQNEGSASQSVFDLLLRYATQA